MSILIYKQRHRHPNYKKTPKGNYAHIGYIATRPGTVKNEGMRHGLFGKLEPGAVKEFDTWQEAARLVRELSYRRVNMYRGIISFSPETAAELGLSDHKAWEDYIDRHILTLAKFNGIRVQDLQWVAAHHIITSSYLRSESMITAVEENIHYLNPPVADVFRGFLAETNMISADVKQALSNMKPKLDNYVFREWVDAAIACQDDKSLKSTLTPIIGKLSDMRIVAAELDYLLYEPFKEFITMAFLLIGNIPLLYFLNKDWYDVLVNTGFGKGILAVCLLVLLISFAAVIRLTKPVEYKR